MKMPRRKTRQELRADFDALQVAHREYYAEWVRERFPGSISATMEDAAVAAGKAALRGQKG